VVLGLTVVTLVVFLWCEVGAESQTGGRKTDESERFQARLTSVRDGSGMLNLGEKSTDVLALKDSEILGCSKRVRR
jgi:hypothetical protein